MDVIGLAAFGYDFEALDNPHSEKVKTYNDVMEGIQSPIYFFFPYLEKHFLWALPHRRELHRKVGVLNDLFNSVIEHKRETLAKKSERVEDAEKDLLTLMLEACEDSENPQNALSNKELRDDLAIFFLAG